MHSNPFRRSVGSAAIAIAALALAMPGAGAAERVLTLDPEATRVRFDLDTTLHHVEGHLYVTSGRVTFDLDGGTASGEIVLDAARTETGNGSRDKKMHKSVLESALYPTIVFRPATARGTLPAEGSGRVILDGTVSIHGADHPLTLEADVVVDDGAATGTATFVVPYVDWGMDNPSLFVLRVAKQVDVTVEAVGRVESTAVAVTPRQP